MQAKTTPPLLTDREVAKLLNISWITLQQWRYQKRGPRFLKLNRNVRYRLADVEAWINALPTGGSQLA